MNTSDFTSKDRDILLQTFRQFRSHYDESDGGYSNRDELEQKMLMEGKNLDDIDAHMLKVALANELPEGETYNYYAGLFPTE